MKRLYVIYGLPYSGKTTYCKSLGIPIVNPNVVRKIVHNKQFKNGNDDGLVDVFTKYMIASLFDAGHESVVLDASNLTRQRRDTFIDKRWTRQFVCINTAKEVCIQRALDDLNNIKVAGIIEELAKTTEPVQIPEEYKSWEINTPESLIEHSESLDSRKLKLLYKFARLIKNIDGLHPTNHGEIAGKLLVSLRTLDGEQYDYQVLNKDNNPFKG